MIVCDIRRRDRGSCIIFAAFDRGVVELSPNNEQTTRELSSVEPIIPK